MKYKALYKTLFMTGFMLSILLILCECSHNSVVVTKNVKVKEFEDRFEIFAPKYCVFINKATQELRFTNDAGMTYSSFPLAVQFEANASIAESGAFLWQAEGNIISFEERTNDDLVLQQIKLDFKKSGFEIRFSVKIPGEHSVGIFCGKKGKTGFDQNSWKGFFSPEPDEYYKEPPMVDVRTINDKQWIFSPAPLNISIETAAGWFSIGLAELGPFTQFGLVESAIWLDIPWQKVTHSSDGLFRISPLIFTFNESEWRAIGDYRSYLDDNNYLPQTVESRPKVDWWRQPVLSTRGEQIVHRITQKNPAYTSAWVKDYITQQSKNFEDITFTIIIEAQWQEILGDPQPSERFADLRKLVDWCHENGHKVILSWKAWTAEANSLAQKMRVTDGDLIDATHQDFESYIHHCCAMMLSAADTALNADGLKITDNFLVREPAKASYQNSAKGMGLQEVQRYMEAIYKQAKAIKPDALIIGSAQAPQFNAVQDMVCINEDWDDKLRREKRARIISQSLPGKLILGDTADMSALIAGYHYVTSSIYGVPCIEYANQFHNAPIPDDYRVVLRNMLKFYPSKGWGRPVFVDYGWWQWKSGNKLIAESIAKGSAIIHYQSKNEGLIISASDKDLPFLLDGMRLIGVKTEAGKNVQWKTVGTDVYRIENNKKGSIYKLKFRRIFR